MCVKFRRLRGVVIFRDLHMRNVVSYGRRAGMCFLLYSEVMSRRILLTGAAGIIYNFDYRFEGRRGSICG